MKKILMITTGGTLACTMTEAGLAPTLKGEDILKYADSSLLAGRQTDVNDLRLIDSSVMTDCDRREIARLIFENREKYDGFLITHGTDSLSYTRRYLDRALENFDRTVVLTGAQKPLEEEGSDAAGNLNDGLAACIGGYKGVCIAMGGRLIPGLSAEKTDTERFDAFISVDGKYIAKGDTLPLPTGMPALKKPEKAVGVIYITPNLRGKTVEKYRDCDRVLALVLGAGGMPEEPEAAFENLKEKGVEVYIKSQCLTGKVEALYEAHTGVKKFTPINGMSVGGAVYSIAFGRI